MAQDSTSKPQKSTGTTIDWRLAIVLWVMVGGLCVVLAHTLAAPLSHLAVTGFPK